MLLRTLYFISQIGKTLYSLIIWKTHKNFCLGSLFYKKNYNYRFIIKLKYCRFEIFEKVVPGLYYIFGKINYMLKIYIFSVQKIKFFRQFLESNLKKSLNLFQMLKLSMTWFSEISYSLYKNLNQNIFMERMGKIFN